jgi:acetolactate synthase I/II/III large subunit
MPETVRSKVSLRGADVVMETLRAAGVDTVFTLSGNHIMSIFDAAIDSGIELLHVRHEAAAVHMADATARLTGGIGVAMVTGGPGHANAVSALYTALQAESPIVLLSGHAPLSQLGRGAFQEMDQTAVAAPCVKASMLVKAGHTLAQDLATAIRVARSGRPGPVAVSLPQDVLDAVVARDATAFSSLEFGVAQKAPSAPFVDTLVDRLTTAKRPLILLGPHMLQASNRPLAAAVSAALGVPVVGMESPRGLSDPALGGFSAIPSQADVIVLVGKKIDFTLRFGDPSALPAGGTFLVSDPEAGAVAHARTLLGSRLVASEVASSVSVMEALSKRSTSHLSADRRNWLERVEQATRYEPAEWADLATQETPVLHPLALLQPFVELAHRQKIVLVSDGGEFGQWAQAKIKPDLRLINGPAGAIGGAVPMAIAAARARPKAVVLAFMGDGAFGFHPAEFDTAVRSGVKFICVVGNDACWNAEYQIQRRTYGDDRLIGCELTPLPYDRVAAAFGAEGATCRTVAEVRSSLTRALGADRPFCVNALISRSPAPAIIMPG